MFLLELVMQGVRGFKDLTRLRFQAGFNFIAAGNEAGKSASVDTVARLLFPRNQAGLMAPLISRYTPDASRGALVVSSDDGAYYRVIQDFSKKAVNLSKYNAPTKEFGLVYKDWDNAGNFMTKLTAGISEEDFARVFIFRRDHYASRPETSISSSPAAYRPAQSNPVGSAGRKQAGNEARLAELREILRKADEAGNVEYQLEAAKIKLGDMAKKLEDMETINARCSDLDTHMAELKGCETLPEDIAELLKTHEKLQSQKMSKSDEMQQDIEEINMQIEGLPQSPLWIDKLFLVGAVLGVGSLAAGLFILSADQADFFPIGVLLSLALIAAAWYKVSRRNAQRKVLMRDREEIEAELAELEKSFAEGGGDITSYMNATGSTTLAELKDKAENYRYFNSLRKDVEEQRQRLLGGITFEKLMSDYHKLQQEVIELEKAMSAVAHHVVDAYSIRQEIERLESESAGIVDFGMMGSDAPIDFGATAAGIGQGGFSPELDIAARAGGIEIETLLPAVQTAAQRNFSAVTMGRYERVEIGHDGDSAVYDKSDERVSISSLSHSAREQFYFCLRVGIVEAVSGKLRLPFILDDPLTGFDPSRQRVACQILRTLSAKTQVILFTSNPALRAEGDAASELK